MDLQGILGIDPDVRNGFGAIKRPLRDRRRRHAARRSEAVVAQSQKRSAVFDAITNPTTSSRLTVGHRRRRD